MSKRTALIRVMMRSNLAPDGAGRKGREGTEENEGGETDEGAVRAGGPDPRGMISSVVRFVDGFSFGGRRADDLTLVAFGRTEE